MLDTASLPTCHDGPEHRLEEIVRRGAVDRTTARRVLSTSLPERGASMPLDAALSLLEDLCERPYDTISSLVRDRLFVVEFEATPHPFPFREVMIRRL